MRKLYPVFTLFFLACFHHSSSQITISYQTITAGFDFPVEVVNAGDGSNRLFIVEQPGRIRIYDPANGGLQATPFLDLTAITAFDFDERGLLSLAFHPQYETNGYFFVYYNNLASENTIARYKVSANPNIADPASGVVLFTIAKPSNGHNGAHLQFGQDGHLYFATGDGYADGNDPANNAQNGLSLLGKMIRINVDDFLNPPYYTVPASNPFVGNPSYDSRVWAVGLRNPFRWSFDRLTGDMWIGDVGQNHKEEINFTPASSTGGENYGWRCYEGSIPNPNITPCTVPNHHAPIFDYDNPPGTPGASVIGGYVYRGNEYPFLRGYYIASDLYSGTVYLIRPDGSGGWTVSQQAGASYIVSYGEGEDGTLYAVSQGSNSLMKIQASSPTLPVSFHSFTGKKGPNYHELQWTTSTEKDIAKFVIEQSANGTDFSFLGEVFPGSYGAGSTYRYVHNNPSRSNQYYRLKVLETTGRWSFSPVVRINGGNGQVQLYPTVVKDQRFWISSDEEVFQIQVVNNDGAVVLSRNLGGVTGQFAIQLPNLTRGLYFVRIAGKNTFTRKIVVE